MTRCRCIRATAPLGALGLAIAIACSHPGVASAALKPTGDIVERFAADPLEDDRWYASGAWAWEAQGTTFSSQGKGSGALLWTPGGHFTGTLGLRFRLGPGQSRARLLFAFDPATGAHRWLEIEAGPQARIALGQTGAVGGSAAGLIQSWRASVAAGTWHDLALRIAADKSAVVTLDGVQLFSAAVAPLAPGQVGFGADGSVTFDEFSFAAEPDGEPCAECHAGQPEHPEAANVYTWWDGRRWDALRGGDPAEQQGGHGDQGGAEYPDPNYPPNPDLPSVVTCTGAPALPTIGGGCHDMRQPVPEDHRNGIREGRDARSVNSFHLRSSAIVSQPSNSWDAQLVFDRFCNFECHFRRVTSAHTITHSSDADPAVGAVQLGHSGSRLDVPLPIDSDLTTRALATRPNFATCVTCHDPHGSGVTDNKGTSNEMLRMDWYASPDLCTVCH